MKLGDDKVPQPGELFQMAPMVDIVFTLLSFFVLATQIRALEQDFSVGYQSSQMAPGALRQDFPETVSVRLRAFPEGQASISVGNMRLPDNDFNALRATLTEINMPALGVVVTADPNLTVDQVAQAIDAIAASPMKNVSLSPLAHPANAPTEPLGRPAAPTTASAAP